MHPFFWFCAILALAVIYAWRIRATVGYLPSPLLHWWAAVVLVGGVMCGGVLATRYQVAVAHDTGVAVQAGVLLLCSWLGLRYWVPWRLWNVPAAALALALVGLYFSQPSQYNNILLASTSLGIAVGGYYLSKRFVKMFFVLYALFDVYMVWCSDLSEQLTRSKVGPFPTSLIVGRVHLPFLEISTLDVALAALAVVCIQRHRGMRRSILFAVACIVWWLASGVGLEFLVKYGSVSVLKVLQRATYVPFLIILAPLTFACLTKPRKSLRP